MRCLRLFVLLVLGFWASTAWGADAHKRILLVTHSGGFMHDSIYVAEQVLKDLGARNGWEVTCYRFTNDPDAKVTAMKKVDGKDVPYVTTALEAYNEKFRGTTGGPGVTREDCGRINAETLKQFDLVLFFTTGNPVDKDELTALIDWVKKGGAFAGTHCATDTLYNTPYGELVGAFFDGHPWHKKILLDVEDSKHPAGKAFKQGDEITDEIYQFKDSPYSRNKLHIILSVKNSSIDVRQGKRKDQDYAISWSQQFGKGRSFYTSLGHRKEVWKDPRYQEHLVAGLKWAMGLVEGDSTPSAQESAAR